jgi:hypothetical protein
VRLAGINYGYDDGERWKAREKRAARLVQDSVAKGAGKTSKDWGRGGAAGVS